MEHDKNDMPVGKRNQRPRSIFVFCLFLLLLAVFSIYRFFEAIQQWSFLTKLLGYPPTYIAFSGLIWGLIHLLAFWLIFWGWQFGQCLMFVWLTAFSLYYWIDRAIIAGIQGEMRGWVFEAGVNLLGFCWLIWIVKNPKAKSYFKGKIVQS